MTPEPEPDLPKPAGDRPAVDDDGVFGPVGLLPDDVDELQDALDGVDRGNTMIRPRRVVQVEDVQGLVRLQGAAESHGSCDRTFKATSCRRRRLTYPSRNFLMIHSGKPSSESISTLMSPYMTGSSVNGQ